MDMKKIYLFVFSLLFIFSTQAIAQTSEGVDSFKQNKDAWRRKENTTSETKGEIVPKIKDSLSVHGINNITQAEKIFCYTVDKANKAYKGYTIDGMAVTGFCGILKNQDRDILLQEFFYKDGSTSNIVAKCIIAPKVMLRFIKGVDYTDVLLSSPCHSFSIFYGGKVKTFNAEPTAKMMEAFVNVFTKNKVDFVSPALLDQLMPIGVANTPEQKALVKEKRGDAPVRNWGAEKPKQIPEEKTSAKKGWNRLKK